MSLKVDLGQTILKRSVLETSQTSLHNIVVIHVRRTFHAAIFERREVFRKRRFQRHLLC